jgi:hypothetical protein
VTYWLNFNSVRKEVLTEAYPRCITAPVYMLDHRPDGENMRAIQRLIVVNPLLSICLFSFSDNITLRIASPLHHLTPARSKHPDGLRGDPVTKTLYRKLPRENVWHFCRNCEHWPQSGFEQRDSSDPPYSFCNGCIQMHRDGKCEWFNEEASPPRRS